VKEPIAHPNFWPRLWLGIAAWLVERTADKNYRSGTHRLHAEDVRREIVEFRDLYYPDVEIRKFP
jgi:hypothetical protein